MRYNKISATLTNYINKNCTATTQSKMQYLEKVRLFSKWVYTTEGTERVAPERTHDLIQQYIYERTYQGKSAQTVNKDLASLCAGTGEKKTDYQHPKRNEAPTKGRSGPGIRTESGARIYDIAPAIGIREDEYRQLKGNGIKEKDGFVYVYVPKGKGGKEQWQLVSPDRANDVRGLFCGKGKDEYIFSKKEIHGIDHSNLHAFRREHAREMYEWYLERTPEEKNYWMREMKSRFMENPQKRSSWSKVEYRIKNSPNIVTRGHNKSALISQGRDITFDREAVMFVSVFCLSHYREDVTVTNYLV